MALQPFRPAFFYMFKQKKQVHLHLRMFMRIPCAAAL